jgi:hypothetical protein
MVKMGKETVRPYFVPMARLYREGYQGIEKERPRVGVYHGWIFFLGVEDGVAEAIDDIMRKYVWRATQPPTLTTRESLYLPTTTYLNRPLLMGW